MLPIAIGQCGMSIDEFEYATARELMWKVEGKQAEQMAEYERVAQLAAWVMNPWLSKPVTADELLGRPRRTDWARVYGTDR